MRPHLRRPLPTGSPFALLVSCLIGLIAVDGNAALGSRPTPVTPLPEVIRGFDFGPAGSPVWPGFQAVSPETLYSGSLGFGWRQGKGTVTAVDESKYDPLTQDFCRPRDGEACFAVKLPAGRYLVSIVSGNLHQFPFLQPQTLRLGSRTMIDWRPEEAEFFKHADLGWWPGESIWKYMKDRYRVETFAVRVSGPVLEVTLQPHFFLNALLVAPLGYRGELEGTLASIAKDRQALFESAYPEVRPYILQADTLSPTDFQASAADRERGFTVFQRLFQRPVYPQSRPTELELEPVIRFAAARGETEPVTVGFLPYLDYPSLAVRVTDLRRADGRTLSATNAVLYRTRFKESVWARRSRDFFVYPRMLDQPPMRLETGCKVATLAGPLRPYPAGNVTQIWLTFAVPPNAAPGVYTGKIVLEPGDMAAATLTLALTVHPFQLRAPEGIVHSMIHNPDYGLPHRGVFYRGHAEKRLWKFVERDFKFMRELGMRGIFTTFLPELEWTAERPALDFADYRQTLDLLARHGLTNQVLNFATSGAYYVPRDRWTDFSSVSGSAVGGDSRYDASITAYCSALAYQSQRGNWPPTWFATLDEASTQREAGWQRARTIARAMKAGGVLTFETVNGVGQLAHLEWIDLPLLNYEVLQDRTCLTRLQEAGKPFGLYNLGPVADRFTWGLYPWRVRAVHRTQWHYRATRGDPFNDFDGLVPDSATIAYATPDRLIPTPFSECVREGVEDGWYLATLEQELAKASPDSGPAVAAAVLIDELRERIPEDYSQYFNHRWAAGRPKAVEPTFKITPEELVEIRLRIAEAIGRFYERMAE